jgi:hypothetical protein
VHKIGGSYFKLFFSAHNGVFLCPTAFRIILGVSGHKLYYAGKFISDYNGEGVDKMPEYVERQKFVHSPKKNIIISFLKHTYDELSIEADPLNKENKKRYALGMVNLIAQ